MSKLLQPARGRASRLFKFGWALALAGLFLAVAPQSANAQQATTGVAKWLCENSPGVPNTPTAFCNAPGAASVQAGMLVYYVVRVTNPGPAITVQLDDTYPSNFTGGAVVCTDNLGNPISVSSSPTSMSGPVPVPANGSVACTILGVFTQPGTNIYNTVTDTESATVQTSYNYGPTTVTGGTLPADLSVTKTVSPPYPQNLDVSNGPQQVTYTITIKNNGPSAIAIGPFFRLHDTFALMPNGVPLDVTLLSTQPCQHFDASSNLVPTGDCLSWPNPAQTLSGPSIDPNMVATSTPQKFVDFWSFGTQLGYMAPGDYLVLTYKVQISRVPWITCVKAPNSDGLRNNAFFDLVLSNGATLSELNTNNNYSNNNPLNNTDSDVSVYTGYYIADPACAGSVGKPPLQITKTLIGPPPPVPWNFFLGVTYKVLITNNSTQTVPSLIFEDRVQEGLGTPPFTGVIATCINCPGSAAAPYQHKYYLDTNTAWGPATDTTPLPGGATRIYVINARYTDPSCTTVPVITSGQIINYARIKYTAEPLGGGPSSTFIQQASATTQMKPQPTCPFVVEKKLINGPMVHFSNATTGPINPLVYTVTYKNVDPVYKHVVGTLIDAVRITVPNYAAALPYQGSFACAQIGGVTGFRPTGTVNGNAVYTTSPAQGARIIDNGIGGGPVTFPPNSRLACTVSIIVFPPAATNPYCRASTAPYADLENLALMDVSTTYNPNLPWPPTGSPYIYNQNALSNPPTQGTNWATAAAHLPQCYNFSLNKFASNPGTNPPAWTSAPNVVPPVNYAVTATNTGMTGIPGGGGIHVFDLPPYPTSGTIVPVINQNVTILAQGGALNWNTALTGPITSASVDNCAKLQATGVLAGPDWYAAWAPGVQPPAPVLQSCAQVPVVATTVVTLIKKIVNETGGTISFGNLTFNTHVDCSNSYNLVTNQPLVVTYGTLLNHDTKNSAPVVVGNVPIAPNEQCTVTEIGTLPLQAPDPHICDGGGSYWETTVAPTPIAITGNGFHVVTVTNTLHCKPGSLKVIKKIVGPGGTLPNTFEITVKCGILNTQYPVPLLGDNGTYTINGIPHGDVCTIGETTPSPQQFTTNGSLVSCPSPGEYEWVTPATYTPSSTIPINSPSQTVTVTNTYQCHMVPGPGSLTLIKTANWEGPALTHPVTFPITLNCVPGGNATYNFNVNNNGSFTQTVTGLPIGAVCTIDEGTPVPADPAYWGPKLQNCDWHKAFPLGKTVTISSTPQMLQVVNQPMCHEVVGGAPVTVQEVKTPIIIGLVDYSSGVNFHLKVICNGTQDFSWNAATGGVFSHNLHAAIGSTCTWEETPAPPLPSNANSLCQWKTSFFYNGVDVTDTSAAPPKSQTVTIGTPSGQYNWLDVQNRLVCPGDPNWNINPVTVRINNSGAGGISTPIRQESTGPLLGCKPPMVMDSKRNVCKRP